MSDNDEQAIRELLARWTTASKAGDTATVLSLMTDDVVFLVAGQKPFGKEAFAAASASMSGMRVEGQSEIQELRVSGDLAYARSHLVVTITMPDGKIVRRSGPVLSIFRKDDGRWRLARDANFLALEST